MSTFDVPTENLLVEVCCAQRVSSHYGDGAVTHFYRKWSSQPALSASTRLPRRDVNFGDSLRPPLTMNSTIAEENRTVGCQRKSSLCVLNLPSLPLRRPVYSVLVLVVVSPQTPGPTRDVLPHFI
jgi:hypothetical protein